MGAVGGRSPGPENVDSCERPRGPDVFKKWSPFEKNWVKSGDFFRFWRGSPWAAESLANWKSEKNILFAFVLLNWVLFEK